MSAISKATADYLIRSTLADVADVLPGIRWSWTEWLPTGLLTALAADPGQGKSAVALDLAKRLLSGETWPDGSPCLRANCVLWADTESSQAILLQRALDWQIPLDRILMPLADPLADFRLDNRSHWDRFVNLAHLEQPGLIVVDSLRGAHNQKEDNSAIHTIVAQLAKLAQELTTAVLVIHHFRKASEFEKRGGSIASLDRLRGSSAIGAMCRVVWGIDQPDTSSDTSRLSVIKSNLSKPALPLGFKVSDNGIIWTKSPSRPGIKIARQRAADFLKDLLNRQPMAAEEVYGQGRLAGFSDHTIQRAKADLGIVNVPPKGERKRWFWSLPEH